MGTSKTFRGGPAWQKNITARGKESYSDGATIHPEGTQMSGGGNNMGKAGADARKKSKSSRSTVKAPVPSGYS